MPSPISSRQRLFASLLSIILLGAAFAAPVAEKRWDPIGDTIDLGYAKYQGTILKDIGINQYLGMRFADSPVGDNRFRAPQPPTKQTEVQQATQVLHLSCLHPNLPIFLTIWCTVWASLCRCWHWTINYSERRLPLRLCIHPDQCHSGFKASSVVLQ